MEKPWLYIGIPVVVAGFCLFMLSMADNGSPSGKKTKSGLQIIDVKVGKGPELKPGDMALVHYTGAFKDGKVFDTSKKKGGQPMPFQVGDPKMIKGFNEGVEGMKPGGIRKIVIPPELGYGLEGQPPVIPPAAELHFEIELLKVLD